MVSARQKNDVDAPRPALASLATLLEPKGESVPPPPAATPWRAAKSDPPLASGVRARVEDAPSRSYAMWIITVLVLALAAALAVRGYGYYILDAEARLDHPDHRILSSTGLYGQGYGVVGTGLIFLNLLYLVRRKLARWSLGSMTTWLNLHVFTGLAGSVLILFHSAFHLRTTIAIVTGASLAVVVATGLIGRYLYALRPTGTLTLEERLAQLETLFPDFVAKIRETRANCKAPRVPADPSLLIVLFNVPRWILEARRRRRAVRLAARGDEQLLRVGGREHRFVANMVREISNLVAGEVDALAGNALLRTWRGMHRFMAILMLLAVAIHIGVAWHYGYRWIFSQG